MPELVAALPPLAPAVAHARKQGLLVRNARRYAGTPYRFNGRTRRGIDCIGLVFRAYEDTYRVPVRAFDRHNASNAAVAAKLGRVALLATAATPPPPAAAPGDVVFLLAAVENPAEPPFARLAGAPWWVWHVGLYTGEGRLLHADPGQGVVEEALADLLQRYAFDGYAVVQPQPWRSRAPAARAAAGSGEARPAGR